MIEITRILRQRINKADEEHRKPGVSVIRHIVENIISILYVFPVPNQQAACRMRAQTDRQTGYTLRFHHRLLSREFCVRDASFSGQRFLFSQNPGKHPSWAKPHAPRTDAVRLSYTS